VVSTLDIGILSSCLHVVLLLYYIIFIFLQCLITRSHLINQYRIYYDNVKRLWVNLSEEQWNLVEDILGLYPVREDRHVGPCSDRGKALKETLWILRNSIQWNTLQNGMGILKQFIVGPKTAYRLEFWNNSF
jgi:hypothetical protein